MSLPILVACLRMPQASSLWLIEENHLGVNNSFATWLVLFLLLLHREVATDHRPWRTSWQVQLTALMTDRLTDSVPCSIHFLDASLPVGCQSPDVECICVSRQLIEEGRQGGEACVAVSVSSSVGKTQ